MPSFSPRRLVAALALAFPWLSACDNKPKTEAGRPGGMGPVPVQTALSFRKDVPVELLAIGNVEPIASVAIKAQVTGELIDVSFTEGQDVKKGDLLFTIQPRLYATQLAQAEAALARDRAQAANAKRELNRQVELSGKGVASREELDRSRAQADALDATVRADEAQVLIAQTQLGYTTIESPINGRTGSIRVRPGNLIRNTSDDPLTTVSQLAPIYVAFSVPEQHLPEIRRGLEDRNMEVTARNPRTGKDLGIGKLTFIENTVDIATGTVLLKATFPNDDRALWPGAFVGVILRLDTERERTMVPAAAVTVGQRGSQVYVVKADETVELRPVQTGRSIAQETVILDGMQPGERVVINGQSRLIPGSKIVEKKSSEPAKPAKEKPSAPEKPDDSKPVSSAGGGAQKSSSTKPGA